MPLSSFATLFGVPPKTTFSHPRPVHQRRQLSRCASHNNPFAPKDGSLPKSFNDPKTARCSGQPMSNCKRATELKYSSYPLRVIPLICPFAWHPKFSSVQLSRWRCIGQSARMTAMRINQGLPVSSCVIFSIYLQVSLGFIILLPIYWYEGNGSSVPLYTIAYILSKLQKDQDSPEELDVATVRNNAKTNIWQQRCKCTLSIKMRRLMVRRPIERKDVACAASVVGETACFDVSCLRRS